MFYENSEIILSINDKLKYQYFRNQRAHEDPLTLQKMRYSIYKAASNPAFICQTADDPILEAFQLSRELKECANFEREFYYAYKDLARVRFF